MYWFVYKCCVNDYSLLEQKYYPFWERSNLVGLTTMAQKNKKISYEHSINFKVERLQRADVKIV